MRKYFGTDGIRRIANTELSPSLVFRVAKAGASVLSKHTDHTPTIFIGRDTRISGTLIESAMIAGFLSYGANVKTLGVIPTPAVAYLTKKYNADASVVISASHNTFEFNGVKYFSNKGMKIPDSLEEEIEEIMDSDEKLSALTAVAEGIGVSENAEDMINNYVDFMYGLASKLINPVSVCEKLTNQKRSISDQELNKIFTHGTKRKTSSKIGVYVPGVESMKMSIAQCCLPVYGDDIVGNITQGDGVKVHRAECRNVKVEGARLIQVKWEEENTERQYDCKLTVLAHDRNFLVTDIVTTVSQSKAPMVKFNATVNQEMLLSTIKMTIQVHNLEQLRTLIANLKKVDSVITVEREN